jgi:hypothetical protein
VVEQLDLARHMAMESRLEPLNRRERRELLGYVAWSTGALRAALFLAAVAIVGALAWRVHGWLRGEGSWWLVAPAVFAAALFVRARRWTGGADLRRRIRADLASDSARVTLVRIDDAIEVEEAEDEGPTFFLHTDDGETLVFAGQYLDRPKARGFPWLAFEVREGAESKVFLGLSPVGEPLEPSTRRPPLTFAEIRALGYGSERWKVLHVPFDELRSAAGPHAQPRARG